MKKHILNLIFLLLIFSANAQKPKSEINQTIDNINAILQENKLVYYTDKNQNGAFIRKISATQKGIITFTDSIPKVEKKKMNFS